MVIIHSLLLKGFKNSTRRSPPHFTSDWIVHLPFWHVGTSEKAWVRCKVDKSYNQTEHLEKQPELFMTCLFRYSFFPNKYINNIFQSLLCWLWVCCTHGAHWISAIVWWLLPISPKQSIQIILNSCVYVSNEKKKDYSKNIPWARCTAYKRDFIITLEQHQNLKKLL